VFPLVRAVKVRHRYRLNSRKNIRLYVRDTQELKTTLKSAEKLFRKNTGVLEAPFGTLQWASS
jgi:hypothetical protein